MQAKPSVSKKETRNGNLPLQPNRIGKRRLFNENDGTPIGSSFPIITTPMMPSHSSILDGQDKYSLNSSDSLKHISLNNICESLNIPMSLMGRFLRPEEARTFVSCNIGAHRLNILWMALINLMAHLYNSTMVVQENSFDIPRMYPTSSPLVYISPSIVLCKLSAKQLYKQIVDITLQIDQSLERLNEDKRSMTTFEETNHFLISQLVRYCVELERGSTTSSNPNSNMKTVLIKEREFISHFQKMIIKRLNFIINGLDLRIIYSNSTSFEKELVDFSSTIQDIAKIFEVKLNDIQGKVNNELKNPCQSTCNNRGINTLELSDSSDGSKSAILGSNNQDDNMNGEDVPPKTSSPSEKLEEPIPSLSHSSNNLIELSIEKPTTTTIESLLNGNLTNIDDDRPFLTPSSPPLNAPQQNSHSTFSLSQPKTTPITKSSATPRYSDDIPFPEEEVSNFMQEEASILMKSANSNITPIIKKPLGKPKKSILKQTKQGQKRSEPSSPLVDGYDSEEEPLISLGTSNGTTKHESLIEFSDDEMSDDLSAVDDLNRNLNIQPAKKQKL